MTIKNKYELEQKVCLVTDPEQYLRIITGILITVQGLKYVLACGTEETPHFAFEISTNKDLSFTNNEE